MLLAGVFVMFCMGVASLRSRPVDLEATVSEVRWRREVVVERFAVRSARGFAEVRPADAFEVRPLGMRHHHDEQVVDHYETESYTVQVPGGVDRVPHTERVACGQDCVPQPQQCHETCTPDDNGFASCRTTCTGGGQDCSTRYCDEVRYREVPRTRPEVRTREVPVHRKVPVEAELFGWKVWAWADDRTLVAEGDAGPPSWPSDEEIALGEDLADGEEERVRRSESYEVVLKAGDGRNFPTRPQSEGEFARFGIGSAHVVRLRGSAAEIDPPARNP